MKNYFKWLVCLSVFGLLASCGNSETKQEDPYAGLPSDVKEKVMNLDEQIKQLQAQLEKNLRAFQNEEGEAQGDVYDEWQAFSESVKEGERYQEKANELREKIISLQQEKVRLLENGVPQK